MISKRIFILCIALTSMLHVYSQEELNNRIHGISTIIKTELLGKSITSSGFFFFEVDSNKNPAKHWYQLTKYWLVTNRHVVLVKDNLGKEHLPDLLTYMIRKRDNGNIKWFQIKLSAEELNKRVKLHKNAIVDVAVIDITDYMKKNTDSSLVLFDGLSENDFPERNKLRPQVADDVTVVGYPNGYYDETNLFPIVKKGIIASRWGVGFNGNPYFLIDCKLFSGSSGSVVISKPNDIVVDSGHIYYSPFKVFSFLGIFSGEPFKSEIETYDAGDFIIQKKQKYDLGVVWYFDIIPEIIRNGISFSP